MPAKLEDKESEVDVTIDLKTASLCFRWFRTEAACNAAAEIMPRMHHLTLTDLDRAAHLMDRLAAMAPARATAT